MNDKGIQKIPGCCWIEVDGVVHEDKSHYLLEKIYAKLNKLAMESKAEGYIPSKDFVLFDIEEKEKKILSIRDRGIGMELQRLRRKCKQVGISISMDSLGLVSTLYILLRTMLKSLANIIMITTCVGIEDCWGMCCI